MIIERKYKKYYVIRTDKNGIKYKRTCTLDYWSNTPQGCWQYSKQGAKNIAERYNKFRTKWDIQQNTVYSILEVPEA